ncbi:MAG: iron-containing alcohol dehydrogenase [Christensenellaceae bacterium]|jgi:alcohol dehydrogenase class IV|nr:iron-containing alcohol dehydrogenase [Christensenellaceae bacterium]
MASYPRFYFPTRIFSGAGSIEQLIAFVGAQDAVFLITDATLVQLGLVKRVTDMLDGHVRALRVYDSVLPDPAIEMVCEATEQAHAFGATAIVCVGGGSVIDAAKSVAMLLAHFPDYQPYALRKRPPEHPSLPCYAIPTTAGTGAEASSAAVLSYNHVKGGIKAETMFLPAVFLDETMMLGLPQSITAETAMDALTHSVESYIGLHRQTILDALNLHVVRLIFRYLPRAYANGADQEARAALTQAACMGGLAMGHSGTGLVHAFSNTMCEEYHDLSHGRSNSIFLPYCTRYNAPAVLDRLADIAQAAGIQTLGLTAEQAGFAAVEAIEQLSDTVNIPKRVTGHTLSAARIAELAENTRTHFITANNPRVPSKEDLIKIIHQAMPL